MGLCTVTQHTPGKTGLTPTGTCKIVDIALSTSYATGGDTLSLASLGVGAVQAVDLSSAATSPGGHAVEVVYGANDRVDPKLRVRDVATGAELGAASNNSAQTLRAVIYGDLPNP